MSWPNQTSQRDEMKFSKSDVNWVVMDYLVTEGYPGAAEKFAQESNLSLPMAPKDIRERVEIRTAIHAGHIGEATEMINEIDTRILDENPPLHFALMTQQLTEMIRGILADPDNLNPANSAAFEPALLFAQDNLAPRVPTGKTYQTTLEKAMALMLFPTDKMPADIKALMDLSMRAKVARDVNRTLLEYRGERPEAKLRQLVRARKWAEEQAREAKIDNIPFSLPLGLEPVVNDDAMVS